jgi:hypothetical protein
MPTEATDRSFGDLRQLNGLARRNHKLRLWWLTRRGVKEWKTVCEMTKWYVGEDIPDPPTGDRRKFESDLRAGFDELLGDLDLWLRSYGLTSGEFEIGSIALHDLPAAIPWVLEIKTPTKDLALVSGLLPLHERVPDLVGVDGNQDAAREAGIIMGSEEKFPAFPALSLLFQAQSEARAGRGRQAVIDAGTAVEILVIYVIGEVMRRRGESEQDIDTLNERRWKTVFNQDLLEVLDVPVGQSGAEHSRWWRNTYGLRVRAVHKGHRPSQGEALQVVSDSWDLFEWIGDRLRTNPDLEDLAKTIPVKRT